VGEYYLAGKDVLDGLFGHCSWELGRRVMDAGSGNGIMRIHMTWSIIILSGDKWFSLFFFADWASKIYFMLTLLLC
jgi:hypothetical protein